MAAAAGATVSASTAGAGEAAGAGDIDRHNSAEILGFGSLGGFGRRRDGRPNRAFVSIHDQSP
jgi:hypothetical protein